MTIFGEHPFKKQMQIIRAILEDNELDMQYETDEDIIFHHDFTFKADDENLFKNEWELSIAYKEALKLYDSYLRIKFMDELVCNNILSLEERNRNVDEGLVQEWNRLYIKNWKKIKFLWDGFNTFSRINGYEEVSIDQYIRIIRQECEEIWSPYQDIWNTTGKEDEICGELDPDGNNGYYDKMSEVQGFVIIAQLIITNEQIRDEIYRGWI